MRGISITLKPLRFQGFFVSCTPKFEYTTSSTFSKRRKPALSNFMRSPKSFFTSESVTEGHPDKLCDQISDAVLDAILVQDPIARVACETATTTGLVLVAGEITTTAWIDMSAVVRKTIEQVGYINADYGFDYRTCGVVTSIGKQSPDIDLGVSRSVEVKSGFAHLSDDELEQIGAGDQGMMIGFACNETPEYMPLTIALAHRLARRLASQRKSGAIPYLGPDGKSQVTVEYAYGKPVRVDTVLISTQHAADISPDQIREDIVEDVMHAVIPGELIDANTKYYVNPTGRFVTGGPHGDAGLTGRKIIVDTYGGASPHGGGAFSGKDPSKVDRSAAYAARYVAKNIVAAGLAAQCQVQLSYAIGVARPIN